MGKLYVTYSLTRQRAQFKRGGRRSPVRDCEGNRCSGSRKRAGRPRAAPIRAQNDIRGHERLSGDGT